jgi:hypothetical protein
VIGLLTGILSCIQPLVGWTVWQVGPAIVTRHPERGPQRRSPTRSKITPAKVTPSQSGLHREATRAPPSSAKSQCGAQPTVSIPKTRDQPEEPNSKRSRPCGNNASTEISRVPPTLTRQQMRGPTSDRPHAPQAATTTSSARTRPPNSVPAGRPRPADSTPAVRSQRSEHEDALHAAMAGQAAHCRIWLFFRSRAGLRPASGACPRFAAGRAAASVPDSA